MVVFEHASKSKLTTDWLTEAETGALVLSVQSFDISTVDISWQHPQMSHLAQYTTVLVKQLTCDGTLFGGSIRMFGSHSPGGNTVTWSKNSSIPANRSSLCLARYATSWNTCTQQTKDNSDLSLLQVQKG